MSALWLDNLAAYSIQFGVLVFSAAIAARVLRLEAPRASQRLWQFVAIASLALPLLQPWRGLSAGFVASSLTLVSDAVRPAMAPPDPIQFPADVLLLLAIIAAIRLAWLIVGFFRLRALDRHSVLLTPTPDYIRELRLDLGTNARIHLSDEIDGPATLGVLRPVVLIPRRVLDLPLPVQRAIICHELLHVTRRDWLHTLAEEIGCALLWFHPAARVLASRLNLARERVVDQLTIARTGDRRHYAEALMAFADEAPSRFAAVTPLIRRNHLAQRIAFVLQEVHMSASRVATVAAACTLVAAFATALAVFQFPMAATLSAQSGSAIYKVGDPGVSPPKVIKEIHPNYTPEAMKAKIQGSVQISAVVLTSGDLDDLKVTKSLDKEYGLDQRALDAASQWKFQPGQKDDKPVAVAITLEMTFTLKK